MNRPRCVRCACDLSEASLGLCRGIGSVDHPARAHGCGVVRRVVAAAHGPVPWALAWHDYPELAVALKQDLLHRRLHRVPYRRGELSTHAYGYLTRDGGQYRVVL